MDRLSKLDYSILSKEALDEETRELYSSISAYKDIVIRNVYKNAMDIIEQEKNKFNLKIFNNDNGYKGIKLLGITPKNKFFNIFYYMYGYDFKQSLGLYEYNENSIKREKEMERILFELEDMYKLIDANPNLEDIKSFVKRIEALEDRYIELDDRAEIPEEDKYISEVQNHFTRLFEKKFDINRKKDYKEVSNKEWDKDNNDGMHRVLKKEYPTLTLKKDVRYY